MTIVLSGMNYQTAPVEVREHYSLGPDLLRKLLTALGDAGLDEAAILSTCNRVEIIGVSESQETGERVIREFFARHYPDQGEAVRASVYERADGAAIDHLFRVASGLESLVLGETEILGQVADALTIAQDAGTAGPILVRLLSAAQHAGRRARTETAISRRSLSIGHAAALLIAQQTPDLRHSKVAVIGAGAMAAQAVRALEHQGAERIHVVNRTLAKSQAIQQRSSNVIAAPFEKLTEILSTADVVITAVATEHPIISASQLQGPASVRTGRPLLVVDIGVPRNVDEAAAALPGVVLHDIDDLQPVVESNRLHRQTEIGSVESIIDDERRKFEGWLVSRSVAPLLIEIRRQAELLVQTEVSQTLQRLPRLDAKERAIVERMGERIVGKLLHAPTAVLKESESPEQTDSLVEAVRLLFTQGDARPGEAG